MSNNPEDYEVTMLIEIPYGGNVKYEIKNGQVHVDRVLYSRSVHYPFNYGYIPNTLADDGDDLDAVLLSQTKFYPGSYICCRMVGVLVTEDEKGMDEKILLVPVSSVDSNQKQLQDLSDLSEQEKLHITHFFETYKKFEKGKWVKINGFRDRVEAWQIYQQSIARYEQRQAN